MAKKKIEIVYDINGKAIDVAIDKTLNLQQQAKALTAELRRTKEGTDEFRLLSKQLGETQDGLAKTSAKSKDLFTSLSLLPGPIGMFFGQLSGSIELLKVFSSFTFKDLKFQLGEVADDLGDIGKNLVETTEAQVVNTAATEAQAVATEEAAAANVINTATLEAETVATEAAEVATISLGAALKALGIGLIVAAVAALVIYWDKLVDAITGATDVTKAYDDAQKQVTKDISDFNVKLFEVNASIDAAKKGTMSKTEALKEYNDKLGKTVGYAGSLEQAEALLAANTKTVIESIKLRAQAQIFYAKSAEASAKMVSGEGLEPDFWDKAWNAVTSGGNALMFTLGNIEDLGKNIAKVQKQSTDFAAEGDKLITKAIENDKKLQKGLAKPPENKTKELKDDNERLLDLARKYQADLLSVNAKGDRERQLQDIKNAAEEQKREVNKLEGIRKENERVRTKVLIDIETVANKKKADLQKQFDDEDLKARAEFFKKRLELEIQAYEDSVDLQIKALTETYNNDVEIYKKQVAEFNAKNKAIQISEEEQTAYLLALQVKFNNDRVKINDTASLKILQTLTNQISSFREMGSEMVNEVDLNIKQFQATFEKAGTTTFMTAKKVREALDSLATKNDLFDPLRVADAIARNMAMKTKMAIDDAKELYDKGKLSKEEYDKFVKEKDAENLEAQKQFTDRLIAYNVLLADSRKALLDQDVEIASKTVDLFQAGIEIADANYQLEQKRLNDRLALYQKDSEEYNKILKEKENLERDHIKKIQGMQIAAAIAEGAIAIARVVIDTQRAIVAFTASVAPLGPVGVPMAAAYAVKSQVLAALSIATIIAQGIAKVKSIQSGSASSGGGSSAGGGNGLGRGYAEGGLIKGRRHAQGGTIIEAEDGEAIMTRGAVTMFGPMLSMMNQAGGGTTFASNLFTRPDNPMVKNPVAETQTQIIKTYVVENELTSSQQRQARLKDLSTL